MTALPLIERKTRLASLLNGASDCLRYNDHQIGHGPTFHRLACEHGVEGIVSKRTNDRYEPDRRTWLKTKCLNREQFVVGLHCHSGVSQTTRKQDRQCRCEYKDEPDHRKLPNRPAHGI